MKNRESKTAAEPTPDQAKSDKAELEGRIEFLENAVNELAQATLQLANDSIKLKRRIMGVDG